MTKEVKLGVVIIAVLVLFMINNAFSSKQDHINELQHNKEKLVQTAVTYNQLKTQWGAKKRKEKLIKKLYRIMLPNSRHAKGKRITLLYKGIDGSMLNKLSHAILSSDATLVNLEITKNGSTATLLVEVAP